MTPNVARAIRSLNPTIEFEIQGEPTSEEELYQMLKIVVDSDENNKPIYAENFDALECTWEEIKTKYDELVSQLPLEQLRAERNRLLAASDWSQFPDVPDATRTLWQPYRQALRDITETYNNLDDVVWPTPPA